MIEKSFLVFKTKEGGKERRKGRKDGGMKGVGEKVDKH